LLSQLLHQAGIENVVLEQRSRTHVESRIRAGVLEQGAVEMLERAGVASRLHREGRLDGVLGLGGSAGTTIARAAPLPLWERAA